ncbi:MAG: twin-arginine translocase TatA/TatE family subunit [Candidatus Bathyarchaeota archaeon]|nr:MAG: twin-arginine translocase TatA/TatE family subunit [Candidatus Bathyarchaeota archaeon]
MAIIGWPEFILILAIILLVFGAIRLKPKKNKNSNLYVSLTLTKELLNKGG